MAMCAYVSSFNDGGATTLGIRQEAIEESISTTVENDAYLQEPLGVYSMLFLTGNFPNPMTVPRSSRVLSFDSAGGTVDSHFKRYFSSTESHLQIRR